MKKYNTRTEMDSQSCSIDEEEKEIEEFKPV